SDRCPAPERGEAASRPSRRRSVSPPTVASASTAATTIAPESTPVYSAKPPHGIPGVAARNQSAGADATTLPSMITWKLRTSSSPSQVEGGYQEVPCHTFQLPTIALPPVASVTWNWQTLPGCRPVTVTYICVPQGSCR